METVIRECVASDVKNVYELICELEDQKFDYEQFVHIFNRKLANEINFLYVATQNEEAIGFLNITIDYHLHEVAKVATLEELVVTDKVRSQGTGRLLVEKAVQKAREEGCILIELVSSFYRKRAHEFYLKNGFEKRSYKFLMELL